MPEIIVTQADETQIGLSCDTGSCIGDVLVANGIPTTNVVAVADGEPLPLNTRIGPGDRYEVRLLEGYDLQHILNLHTVKGIDSSAGFKHDRIRVDRDGRLSRELEVMNPSEFCETIEETASDFLDQYDLVSPGETVLVGLSGEIDSTAMLLLLETLSEDFDVCALTVEKFWEDDDEQPLSYTKELCGSLGVSHTIATRRDAERLFGVDTSFDDIIERLAQSDYTAYVGAITDQIIACLLENHAYENEYDTIALGDTATDLIAGLLDALVTGQEVGNFPKRKFGECIQIFPVSVFSKSELYAYQHFVHDRFMDEFTRNPWSVESDQQALLYYLAELLQTNWPGIRYWILENTPKTGIVSDAPPDIFSCQNCGKKKSKSDLAQESPRFCFVCSLLMECDYLA